MGYWNRPDETEDTFRARTAKDQDGPFLRSGDLGFMAGDQLYITGRLKDMMIVRGRNYYPQDIEQTVGDAHEALRPDGGAVVSTLIHGEEQVVVVHEVDRQYRDGDFEEIIRAVRRLVSQQHDLDVYSVVLIRHASLPRTTSGKAQRHVCRDFFLTDRLNVLAQWKRTDVNVSNELDDVEVAADSETAPTRMTRPDHQLSPDEIARLTERVESWLLNWLVERAAIPVHEIHRDKPFAEYGLDSMTAVELSLELEDWLGVEVVPTVAWNYPTAASLARYLALARAGMDDAAGDDDAPQADQEFESLLREIESLSPEEAQRLLEIESA
jgi:acyl carrier protein